MMEPDTAMFDRLYELCGGAIKLVDMAPEVNGALPFIQHASKKCVVSIAHTCANYDEGQGRL